MEDTTKEIYWNESPNVLRTKYFTKEEVLEIEFRNRQIYQYQDVPSSVYDELKSSTNIGKFLFEKVKGIFRYYHVNGN